MEPRAALQRAQPPDALPASVRAAESEWLARELLVPAQRAKQALEPVARQRMPQEEPA
jgi:hypothetical protein